jgi:hypothetical protein
MAVGHGVRFGIGRQSLVIGTGALLTGGLALGACGGSSFSIVRAYGDTVAARTAKVTFNATMTIPGPAAAGASIHLTGAGATDLATPTGSLTVDVPGAGAIEERMVDGTVYMHYPNVTPGSGLPAGKTWVSMNFGQLCGNPSMLGGSGAADPTSILSQLRNNSTTGLQDLGSATVAGVQTTHYRATLDLAKEAKTKCSSGPLSGVIAKQAARVPTMPADIWVDSADRIRQMRIRMDMPVGTATAHLDMTMGFSGFGVPVDVAPPSPAETIDATQLPGFNQALQAGGNG